MEAGEVSCHSRVFRLSFKPFRNTEALPKRGSGEGALSPNIHRPFRHSYACAISFRIEDFLSSVCTRHVGEVAAAPGRELAINDACKVSRDCPFHLACRCDDDVVLPLAKSKDEE